MIETYYREVKDERKVFDACFQSQLPLLIKGPTGCGKSQFVNAMADHLGRPIVKVSCNEDTSAADLLGRFIIKNMETVWQDGPATKAVREGSILYLDEIAEAREDVIVVLHSLTDHRRSLYIDRTGEALVASDTFMCVASFNPGYQRGLKELKPSTRQRFVTLAFDYPPENIEIEVVSHLTKLSDGDSKKLVRLARKIRDQPQLGLKETVSTRLLIHAGVLIKRGFSAREACNLCIAQVLTDDPKSTIALQDLIALHF